MSFLNISMLDTKKLICVIKDKYNVDYANYSLTSFKQRIDNVINIHNLGSVDRLIDKIQTEDSFKDIFYRDMTIPGTEMFRDPAAWRELAKFLAEKTDKPNLRIWVPFCSTGEETYTLAIVLKELGILNKTKVFVSNRSPLNIKKAKSGEYPFKQFETNFANYKRYKNDENANLGIYYNLQSTVGVMNTELIKNFEFIDHALYTEEGPKRIDVILFRNKLIYYNIALQEKVLNILRESLLPAGCLFIGIKETIEYNTVKDDFICVNKEEGIYKKKA